MRKINPILNQIKAYIVASGFTMKEAVELASQEYGWSESLSNFSGKLNRGSIRYQEAVELASVLGYEVVWVKHKD